MIIGSAPVFSVSDFVGVFNQSISLAYPEVAIVGELSNFRISKNTWVYFDLKDESATVKFFGSVRSLPGPLEDGMMLEVNGRPYLHPQFGFSVQLNFLSVTGEGSINKAQQLLMKKLEKEGLFDIERKRELPYAPEVVAIVSSKESAGYGDFIKVTKKRWPSLKTKLFDVKVQGFEAVQQISSAINKANQGNFEVLVVIRGGGSRDDLSAFDHEQVVRAVASSRIPTIIAIGHERDIILAEMVADKRASTPSNAGEILVPDVNEEKKLIKHYRQQISGIIRSFTDDIKKDIESYQQLFYGQLEQKYLDSRNYYTQSKALINAYDPKLPMKKGYAIARLGNDLIKTAKDAKQAKNFNLEFIDAKINVKTGD